MQPSPASVALGFPGALLILQKKRNSQKNVLFSFPKNTALLKEYAEQSSPISTEKGPLKKTVPKSLIKGERPILSFLSLPDLEEILTLDPPSGFISLIYPDKALVFHTQSVCISCLRKRLLGAWDAPKVFNADSKIHLSPSAAAQQKIQTEKLDPTQLHILDFETLGWKTKPFTPHPTCLRNHTKFQIDNQPLPNRPESHSLLTHLKANLQEPSIGLLSATAPIGAIKDPQNPASAFHIFQAKSSHPSEDFTVLENDKIGRFSLGADFDPELAELKAIVEGLERYCLKAPLTQTIRSRKEIEKQPRLEVEEAGKYLSQKLKSDLRSYFPGYSLQTRESLWIDTDFIYYGDSKTASGFPSNSNGGAAHASLNQAIESGVLELIERDAVMKTWLEKRIPFQLPLSLLEPKAYALWKYLQNLGYRVHLLDISVGTQVPVTLCLAEAQREDLPYLFVGASAAKNRAQSIEKSLAEVLVQVHVGLLQAKQGKINYSTEVKGILDHRNFYLDPQQKPKWDFLLKGTPLENDTSGFSNLSDLLSKELKDKRVFIADITLPEIKAAGLHVIRAVSPDLQPIYFGEQNRFINSSRFPDSCLDSLNPFPHPFA